MVADPAVGSARSSEIGTLVPFVQALTSTNSGPRPRVPAFHSRCRRARLPSVVGINQGGTGMLWVVIVVAIIVVLLLARAGTKHTDQDTVTSRRPRDRAGATQHTPRYASARPSSRTPALRPTDRTGPAPAPAPA